MKLFKTKCFLVHLYDGQYRHNLDEGLAWQ